MKKLITILFLFWTSAHAQTGIFFDFNPAAADRSGGGVLTNTQTWVHYNPFKSWSCNFPSADSVVINGVPTYSERFELRRTDSVIASSKRTEMGTVYTTPAAINARYYYVKLVTPVWQGSDPIPECFMQVNDTSRKLGVKAEIIHTGRNYYLVNQFWQDGVTYVTRQWFVGTEIPGVPIEFLLHYEPGNDTTGIIELWVNGIPVLLGDGYEVIGPNASMNVDGIPYLIDENYFKYGCYKWRWNSTDPAVWGTYTTRVVYFLDVKLGNASASYSSFYPTPPIVPVPRPLPEGVSVSLPWIAVPN